MRFPGFIGPSYTLQSVNVDCQRSVNLFPEINALGTGKEKEVASLVPTPGLRLLLTLTEGPVRAMWKASNGQLFVVSGSKFYRISSSWVPTELGSLNTSSGPVSMADNGIYVVAVDGTYGYTWNINTNTYAQIVDVDFPGANQVTFQDGYLIFNQPDTQKFFISGLNDVTFDPLDFATVEGSPDNLVGVISSNQNVVLFGSQTTEVYYNSGDADFPFARIQGAIIKVGCAAPSSIRKLDSSIFWVGGDDTGTGIVYKSQGYQAMRISTPAIESTIRSLTSDQVAAATAFVYQQGGHQFYCLNLPGTQSTWCYDVSTGFWHERTYSNLWSLERHRAECSALAYGQNVVGDYENGRIFALDPDVYDDNGISIARIRTAPHISKDNNFVRHNAFNLDMETGVGTSGTGQGVDPKAMMRWSDDGGHSWSNERWVSIGKIGKYKTRAQWNRLGMSRDRVYEIKITDPVKVVLIGADLDLEEGTA